jgi:beta-1,4-mannosyltransferase
MQIMMMPDYRADNPYQTLLAEALVSEDTSVQFPIGYRRGFPLWRSRQQSVSPFEVLHLHWTNPYLKGNSYWVKLIYSIKFLIDIWLVKLSGVRVVWTVHNLVSHEARFPNLECWVHRQLSGMCDRIIVHHQDAKLKVVELYRAKAEKISIVPHGHYQTAYGPAINKITARQQLGLKQEERVYLNFGMLRPYKGIEALLEVWQTGRFYDEQATLLIAGKPMDEAYRQVISDAVSQTSKVILNARHIDDADIPVYFSAADIAILPFKNVSTSGSLLLAMSYGKPIIAPRIGGVSETLGEADWLLYDFIEEEGLLYALKKSMAEDSQALTEVVFQVCDRMGWDAIAQKTYQLYQSIL